MSHDPQSPTDAADFEDDDEVERCPKCGAALDDGEGYNGMCGNCADYEEEDDGL